MELIRLAIVIVAAGVLASFTDWLFMGVINHKLYEQHPEVWREGRQERNKIIVSTLWGALGSAAFAALGYRLGVHGVVDWLLAAVLVWAAGPAPLLAMNVVWMKFPAGLGHSHAAGWLARFVITGLLAALIL